MAWASRTQARAHWADAKSLPDDVLDVLLEAATEACAAYAPVVPQPYPMGYMLATVYHAREIHSASSRDSGDVIGFGDFAIRARPLTASVKSLLRPQRGRKATG